MNLLPVVVITYATQSNRGLDLMIESFCRIGGIEPVVLGMGNGHSWMDRTKELYGWCKANPGKIAIHADGYDSCCVDLIPGQTVIDDSVLFGSEANCWPNASLAKGFPFTEHRYRYLNGGTWMAKTESYVKLVDDFDMLADTRIDQEYYSTAYLSAKSNIVLDVECCVFHNLFMAEDDWSVDRGKYRVRSVGSRPWISHGNGKSDIWKVWDAMGV
jgi:hypothetical protein